MGKISPVSSKYIVHASIIIDGVVDRPDVIGAVFGQTEGLLGADLELRELQRSGRIGRIEVNTDIKGGKTQGEIVIPSSLDKAETSIVGASLEVIKRIGPCNAKIRVTSIEDVRISKRTFVIERAKELLRDMIDQVMPDSQEIADEVAQSVRVMEITEYGTDRLPAGPTIDDSEEIVIVEGRADVLTMLKYGFKNVIALNGTSIPQTVLDLCKQKDATVFVDGDRGGRLIVRDLMNLTDIDHVAMAPDGKEVEELTKKEIHKALRSKITKEQALAEMGVESTQLRQPLMKTERAERAEQREQRSDRNGPRPDRKDRPPSREVKEGAPREIREPREARDPQTTTGDSRERRPPRADRKVSVLSDEHKKKFSEILEGLVGTRGACLIDDSMNVMGKVPLSELSNTLESLKSGIYAVICDGKVDDKVVEAADKSHVKHLVAMESAADARRARVNIVTAAEM